MQEFLMDHGTLYLVLACAFGLFMAWGIGANDVANAVGTAVGAKAITIVQAIWIAGIFEFLGAVLAGGHVTQTIRSGLIQANQFASTPQLLIYGMLAALLAAGTWLLIASRFGWPVSTTHSIVGAIIGFAWIELGASSIDWRVVISILLSWIITPIIAGILSFFIFMSIQWLIFNNKKPEQSAKRYLPFYIFAMVFVVSAMTLIKGLKYLMVDLSYIDAMFISIAISFFAMLIAYFLLRKKKIVATNTSDRFTGTERIFAILMIFTACAMAFAHGSNDIANAIGPVAAVVSIVSSHGDVNANSPLPIWILIFGAVGVVLGLAMYGHKVIATIGSNITELTPSRGFAASLATASTVIMASGTGLPISTTQTLVGAVLGVGIARGIAALNLRVIAGIFMSWVVTLPAGAFLSVVFFMLMKLVFSA